jgi:hypothetical protein
LVVGRGILFDIGWADLDSKTADWQGKEKRIES